MDATDRVCRMLEERGVEYVSIGGITNWEHAEYDELADGSDTRLIVYGATPEQAIAATVGAGTLTAEQVRECLKGVYFEGYSDGATHRVNGIEETDWQAIADELNATVGAGTCCYIPDDKGFTWWDENDVEHYEEYSASDECGSASCDKCGYTMMVGDEGWFDGWDEITDWWEEDGSYHKGYILKPRFKHCPNCGKRIEEEE